MKISALTVSALLALGVAPLSAQGFHSVQSANLPTAETMPSGAWLFEISHRFLSRVSDGADALWGFDGPVRNRLGLSYSPTGSLQLGVLRSNYEDNLELNAKLALVSTMSGGLLLKAAAMGGVAWNTEAPVSQGADDNEMQAYAQLILNAGLGDRLAIGVVPTWLYNPTIVDPDAESVISVGVNGQYYATDSMSLLAEWIVSEARAGTEEDGVTFGIELETRGHFFKLVLSNQVALNPTQVLAGTPVSFEPDEWRVGFNITRLLPF